MLELIGEWVKMHDEAIRLPRPTYIDIQDKPDDFLLKLNNTYYLFCNNLPTVADPNVTIEGNPNSYSDTFQLPDTIESIQWMDNGEVVDFTQNGNQVTVRTKPFLYGRNTVVRIAKIQCK